MSSRPRRRRPGAGDGDIQEPLLAAELDSSAPAQHIRQPQQHQALILHRPFNLELFIRQIVQSWLAFLRNLSSYLQALLRGDGAFSLSLVQAERLEELQESLAIPFDGSNALHQDRLRELWRLAFPDVACETLKTPKWKDMGWQGEDPGTDIRGAGVFGLDNLLYLGTYHSKLFDHLLHKRRGVWDDVDYPFAAASMNLTFTLADVLGIARSKPGMLPKTAAGRAFCQLLTESDVAFEEVYCVMFALLDHVWVQRKASYMEFGAVLKQVRDKLDAALQSKPQSIRQLKQHLGLQY